MGAIYLSRSDVVALFGGEYPIEWEKKNGADRVELNLSSVDGPRRVCTFLVPDDGGQPVLPGIEPPKKKRVLRYYGTMVDLPSVVDVAVAGAISLRLGVWVYRKRQHKSGWRYWLFLEV